MELIKVENLNKNYVSYDNVVTAAKNINLTVMEGDFILIFGPSGSGKTTLLNLLAGLDKPDTGRIFLGDQTIDRADDRTMTLLRRKEIGVVFQSFELIPVMTCYENIEYPLLLNKIPRGERKKRIDEITSSLGIKKLLHRVPAKISGGQKQRVAIARALVSSPRILLGDEISGSLDTNTTSNLFNTLLKLNKDQKQSFIIVTHDQSLKKYATRTFNLVDGSLTEITGE